MLAARARDPQQHAAAGGEGQDDLAGRALPVDANRDFRGSGLFKLAGPQRIGEARRLRVGEEGDQIPVHHPAAVRRQVRTGEQWRSSGNLAEMIRHAAGTGEFIEAERVCGRWNAAGLAGQALEADREPLPCEADYGGERIGLTAANPA